MTVKVQPCTSGHQSYFRLTWGDGHWQNITGETWTRKVASNALDVLSTVYGLDRRNVRFKHR